MNPLLEVRNIKTYFPIRAGFWQRVVDHVRAVDDVSFALYPEETLGLVGESGCGKSTLARTLMQLTPSMAGDVRFIGQNLSRLSKQQLIKTRLKMQMVFQNPLASLNPRMTVEEIITDALVNHRLLSNVQARQKAAQLLDACGLARTSLGRFPHAFSGGQCQRIAIARALALDPKLLICDEPVAALDVSVQAQILNLLKDLQQQQGIAYLFISHDMGVIRFMAQRVAVMYLGRIVELTDNNTLFDQPKHPYTKALLAAIPAAHPDLKKGRLRLKGDAPDLKAVQAGCAFANRCINAVASCRQKSPPLQEIKAGHWVACSRAQKGEI
jgi:oligopeptide/dipeptide ABC transporter ATP-binding protein